MKCSVCRENVKTGKYSRGRLPDGVMWTQCDLCEKASKLCFTDGGQALFRRNEIGQRRKRLRR